MSSETNKLLCAILTSVLFLLLTSFISELIFKPDEINKNISYTIKDNSKDEIEDPELKEEKINKEITNASLAKLISESNELIGEKFIKKNCSACHEFSLPHKNKIGPSLALLLNRKVGSLDDYKYSKAFMTKEANWDLLNLYYFLKNPKEWIPGTKMSYRGIKKENDLVNVLKFLSYNTADGS